MVAENVGNGLASLVAFSGITVPSRAKFVGHALASTTYCSLTIGLVCGQVGMAIGGGSVVGPLVPYLLGSWFGFSFGCIGFWKRVKSEAIVCARRYPKILAHSLLVHHGVEVPPDVTVAGGSDEAKGEEDLPRSMLLEKWICDGGLGRLSFAILAAQDCREDVEEMQREERKKIMEEVQGGT